MRPALKPGLLPVWRNRDTVQIGIDPRRAIALTGMRDAARMLRLLDGSRSRAQVITAAADLGIPAEAADRVLTLLAAGGALDDIPASTSPPLTAATRSRLSPELATAALANGDGDGGARTLARRQLARVRVHGTSRAGLQTAGLLTMAGIGQVTSTGPAPRTPEQAGMPPPPDDPAMPALGRARSGPASGRRPDLVIIVDTHQRDLPDQLTRGRIPHLVAAAGEAIGVVGPLVLPGASACVRCLDLARADRDPAWPLILAQLAGRAADPLACDAVLATTVAAQTAAQALRFIDRGAAAADTANGTIELILPDWRWRRRSWEPHQRCGCGSARPT